MKTDEEWMREYQKGSEKAFSFLYEKYSPMVFSYIKRRLRSEEVDDLYQKVWRQLHEKRDLYKDQPFAPWFFVIIRHLLIDEYRSLGRRNVREVQEELIDRIYQKDIEEGQDLDEILELIPPESRDLVRKYYLEGISYEELAKSSGLSQTNLRQRLSRALKGLRSKLNGQ